MKNLSLVFNGILLIAVAILFYLHFSGPKENSTIVKPTKDSARPALTLNLSDSISDARILFIDIDTLDKKYKKLADLKKNTEGNTKRLQDKYQRERQAFEQAVMTYQQKAQQGAITSDEAVKTEASLRLKQEEILKLEQEMEKIIDDAQKRRDEIIKELMSYFKEFSEERGIDYILPFSRSLAGGILFANEKYNITNEIIEALNSQSASKK